MKAKKYILLLLSLLFVCSAAYSQNKYTIKKDETLWNVAEAMLEENGKTRPTNGEIMNAMKAIAKANGCSTVDECRDKFFYDTAIARGSVIIMPSNYKAPQKVEKVKRQNDEALDELTASLFFAGLEALAKKDEKREVESKEPTTIKSTQSSIPKENSSITVKPKQDNSQYEWKYKLPLYRGDVEWGILTLDFGFKEWNYDLDDKWERFYNETIHDNIGLSLSLEEGKDPPSPAERLANIEKNSPITRFINIIRDNNKYVITLCLDNKQYFFSSPLNKAFDHHYDLLMDTYYYRKRGSSSINSTQTKTNTTPAKVISMSPAEKMYSQKQMTIEQMVDHPLGFLCLDSSGLLYADAMKQLKDCKITPEIFNENEYVSLSEGDYNLTWKGMKPFSATCVWANGKLSGWNYVFYMDYDYKGKNLNESYKINMAEELVNSLKANKGVNFTQEAPYKNENRKFYRRGNYGNYEVTIELTSMEQRVRLSLDISTIKTKIEEKEMLLLEPRDLTMKELIAMPLGILKTSRESIWEIPFSQILSAAYSKSNWEKRKEHGFWIQKGYDFTYRGNTIDLVNIAHRGESSDIYEHEWYELTYTFIRRYSSKETFDTTKKELNDIFDVIVKDLKELGIEMTKGENNIYANRVIAEGKDGNSKYTVTLNNSSFNKKSLKTFGNPLNSLHFTIEKIR